MTIYTDTTPLQAYPGPGDFPEPDLPEPEQVTEAQAVRTALDVLRGDLFWAWGLDQGGLAEYLLDEFLQQPNATRLLLAATLDPLGSEAWAVRQQMREIVRKLANDE